MSITVSFYFAPKSLVNRYKAAVSGTAADGFTVTNTLQTPDTGDHSNIALWAGAMIVSLLGMAVLVFRRRREEL